MGGNIDKKGDTYIRKTKCIFLYKLFVLEFKQFSKARFNVDVRLGRFISFDCIGFSIKTSDKFTFKAVQVSN